MRDLTQIKQLIKEYYNDANCGIYNTRNIAGDTMIAIYDDGEISLDICPYWNYYEVFGLTNEEWDEIYSFYYSLDKEEEEPEENEIEDLINDLVVLKSIVKTEYPMVFKDILDRAIKYIRERETK